MKFVNARFVMNRIIIRPITSKYPNFFESLPKHYNFFKNDSIPHDCKSFVLDMDMVVNFEKSG